MKQRGKRLAVAVGFGLLTASSLMAEETDIQGIYKKKCAMCHKADGKGYAAMKTPDFTSKEWQGSRTDEQLIETTTKGKASMPEFGKQLKPEEIKALITDVVRKFAE
ncbi:MAG: c-type cytochrome [Gammaproteobacteria bacterium]